VSGFAPAVRCGAVADDVAWVCGDHLNDGFDLALTRDGLTFTPVGCMEEAVPADCAADACAASVDAYDAAGAYGGGQCAVEAGEPKPCGCGEGSAAALLLPLALRRRKR
jgi:hypothetical protein